MPDLRQKGGAESARMCLKYVTARYLLDSQGVAWKESKTRPHRSVKNGTKREHGEANGIRDTIPELHPRLVNALEISYINSNISTLAK